MQKMVIWTNFPTRIQSLYMQRRKQSHPIIERNKVAIDTRGHWVIGTQVQYFQNFNWFPHLF